MSLKSHIGKVLAGMTLTGFLSLHAMAQAPAVPATLEQEVQSASEVLQGMLHLDLQPEQRAKLDKAMKDAHGFAVFPNVLRFGVGITKIQGSGVMAYRDRDGEWSVPIPLLVQGTGTGPHGGALMYSTLIVIKTPAAMQRILSGQQRMQGTEAIGPIQTAASAEQDIVSYTKNRGLVVGVSTDDLHITLNQQAIAALYGKTVEPREIMSGQKVDLRGPPCVQLFVAGTNKLVGKAPNTTYWK
jgi:lipid-binding SYLF domain-containing protein